MLSKAFTTAAMALAYAGMASAQTFTECNPLEKTCPPNPAFGDQKIDCDFAKGECSAFHNMIATEIKYSEQGALFQINTETEAPTIRSDNYLMFGRLDVVVQAAKGAGIVTSVVLQSDDLDEIDWEWTGGDDARVQSNYFAKGDTTSYDRAIYHPVSTPLDTTHKYSVEWTSKKIDWLIDDVVVRTLNAAEVANRKGYEMPQTPMQVKLGTWVAGGKNSNEGTREWAGGFTDFKQAPFDAYYRSVTIIDYAGKDAPGQSGAKEYVWTDKTGSWESIKVKKTLSEGNDEETSASTTVSNVPKTTQTAQPTKTKTEAHTTIVEETTSVVLTKTETAQHESKTYESKTLETKIVETKTESAKETKIIESKTESAKETKIIETATTFSTAKATATAVASTVTTEEAAATPTEDSNSGSGSSSGSGSDSDKSESDSGADSGSKPEVNPGTNSGAAVDPATPSGTATEAAPSDTTPIAVNSGSRMTGSIVTAFAGLMIAQILI
ncbi:hypothetical protein FIE12Z_9050 [Fusarium flagelliforme]|uniref:Crh-like protein n=1 Tax=Fusarium flagelliforme TaxID=2675880 RepID=A0A395MFN9_9HYPO|nr:hypothetical protein FIE12Z_9050 [Fusarium flagelliforme]